MAPQPAKVVRSERLATRRKEVRRENRRRRRRVTFATIALIAIASGGWVLARSSLFALEGIEVTGTKLLTPAEVLQASGLHRGQSMLGLHVERVRARIASLPLVREVTVERVPTARIRIAVVERTPSFVLETVEARWFMDAAGMVLGEANGDPSLPTIRVADSLSADVGDRVSDPASRDAMTLWSALPKVLRTPGATIDAATLADLTLERPAFAIRFGSADALPQKLEAVRLVLDRVRRSGGRVLMLDVRSPDRPAAKMA